MSSLSECIPWITVGLAESVAIVTLNLFTIIVFIRNRNLRKRSMYLVMNLAVIDMFLGGCAVYDLFYAFGTYCNLWNWDSIELRSSISIVVFSFCRGSLLSIAIIALERMHATLFPFRHRVLKKWVYLFITAAVWVTSGLLTLTAQFNEFYYSRYLHFTFVLICLLFTCVSYTSIVIKVRCGGQPRQHGAASRERKLTMTLFIVTVVSLLLCLPHIIWKYVLYISKFAILQSLSSTVAYHLDNVLLVLIYANSFVNPILYAIRMPGYRSPLLELFCKRTQRQQRQVAVLPLHDM